MISIKLKYKLFSLGVLALGLASCSDPWEDRASSDDVNLSGTLDQRISTNPDLSEFARLLTESGYDDTLAGSKSYTVFAPTNAAIAQIDASQLADQQALSRFVANHIALTSFSSITEQDTVSIKMLSDKYLELIDGTRIDDASLSTPDQYASNGIYHIIDRPLTPKLNIWEYIEQQAPNSAMSQYLIDLDELNIYESDSLAKANVAMFPENYPDSLSNTFLKNVYNLRNEENRYTFFLMENSGFATETDKLMPYLQKGTQDSTETYTNYYTVRDMAFLGARSESQLPDSLVSQFGVSVPINKDAIVGDPINLSNGILYRMQIVDVPLEDRLINTIVQGEDNISFLPADRRGSIFYRDNINPETGELYNDILVQNPGVGQFTLNYRAPELFSTTYQVYWRALNPQTNSFEQQVRIGGVYEEDGSITDVITTLPYVEVTPGLNEDVYVGEFTLEEAGNLELLSLIAANTGTNGNNSLTLDYLKLVPVVK